MTKYCVNCGQVEHNGMFEDRCKHPTGHKVREVGSKHPPKPLPKVTSQKADRTSEYLTHIANARSLMQQALAELQKARDIRDGWDLEFAQRGLRTQVYFIDHNAKF